VKELTPDQFDAQIRQSLEGLEMPYNAAAWAKFEATLPPQTAIPSSGNSWLKGALAAFAFVGAGVAYYHLSQDSAEPLAESMQQHAPTESVIEQNVTVSDVEESNTTEIIANPNSVASAALPSSKYVQSQEVSVKKASDVSNGMTPASKVDGTVAGKPNSNEHHTASNPDLDSSSEVLVDLKMSKRTVCVGEKVDFRATTRTAGLSYEWVFTDGETYSGEELTRSFATAGQYEVTMIASKEGRSWERNETLTVSPAPEPRILGLGVLEGKLPVYNLTTELQSGEKSIWRFDDNTIVHSSEVRHLFRRKNSSEVELVVTNSHGCATSVKESIPVDEDFNLFAAGAFSPNVDNLNETFLPAALLVLDCAFEMIIHDSNRKEIFRTADVGMPWNGRDKYGKLQPKGVYFWTVELKEDLLKDKVFRGSISIR